MRAPIPSALAVVFAFACAPVTGDTLGDDNSREILSELRKINEMLREQKSSPALPGLGDPAAGFR